MKFRVVCFNLYLAIACLLAVTGCASGGKKKKEKEATTISLHLEARPDGTDKTAAVPIYREKPVYVTIIKEPFLDEGAIDSARVVDEPGGLFHLELKFDWRGTMILDGITTDNHNRRVAVLAAFGNGPRWIAAPIIRQRMGNGTFSFTPDATREEAERIVRGLKNIATELKKQDKL